MNNRENSEILVIHSETIYQHRMMYRYMSDWLSRFDVTVRRYRDWLSEVPDMYHDGGTRHLAQDRKIQRSTAQISDKKYLSVSYIY